jgi:hypothetical protein
MTICAIITYIIDAPLRSQFNCKAEVVSQANLEVETQAAILNNPAGPG